MIAMNEDMFLDDAVEIASAMLDRMSGEERAAIQMLIDEAKSKDVPDSHKTMEGGKK